MGRSLGIGGRAPISQIVLLHLTANVASNFCITFFLNCVNLGRLAAIKATHAQIHAISPENVGAPPLNQPQNGFFFNLVNQQRTQQHSGAAAAGGLDCGRINVLN